MKLKYVAFLLTIGSSLGNSFADELTQVDGTVTINGEVVNQTCKVDGNSDITVTLPTVSTTTLNAAGKKAGMTPFPITLTGCTATTSNSSNESLKSIGVYFSSFNVGENGTLENIESSGAKNVNIQLLDKNQNVIKLSDNAENQVKYLQDLPSEVDKKITFDYYAQYYSTGASTPGVVKASVPFVIVYK